MNIKLYSLIRYLQKPGGISIAEFENKLNVSRATVFRYLETLQNMNRVYLEFCVNVLRKCKQQKLV